MSWAIDKNVTSKAGNHDSGKQRLLEAIQKAADKGILLFCANPDKGPGYVDNQTYPKSLLSDQIFCIGAATQNGVRWGQIDANDKSCNYFLPGVELGIQVESTSRKNLDEPPHEWYVLCWPISSPKE